jgi:hypothetical protein
MHKDSIEQALSTLEAEKANLSTEQRQRLAKLSEAGGDVRKSVSDALNSKEKRELPPEQADKLIGKLKSRFELPTNEYLRKTLGCWADVEKSLRADPEALFSICILEETGGEPQVVGIDGDELIIEDRSKESPSGRRNRNFDEADAQRRLFGYKVKFQTPASYRVMQKTDKFDLHSLSWLETSDEFREIGRAMCAGRFCDITVNMNAMGLPASDQNKSRGWRASIRVKKA